MDILKIKNLHVKVENKEVLKKINLTIKSNENVFLLGPNGQGKSTLLLTIMGHPKYVITKGSIFFNDIDITKLSADERSHLGIFLSFQNPIEVPGVNNNFFLKNIFDIKKKKSSNSLDFYKKFKKICCDNNIKFETYNNRNLNDGFSGGEKKYNEILQMLFIEPKFSMLDEIDSGLDIGATKTIASIINKCSHKGMIFFIVSHYTKFIDLLKFKKTRVLVMLNGEIVLEGDKKIISNIEKKGYEWIKK